MITTRKRSRRKFDCLLRHSIPERVAWRQIIAKNRDRLRVDHYRAALLDLWEGNERSERRRRRPRSLDRKEEVTRGLEGGEVGEGTLEGRGIKRGKKEIHNTRVTNYSWAHPGSSWLQRGSHENVLWAGRVVVFRPISLSLFLFLLRAREKIKKKEGRERNTFIVSLDWLLTRQERTRTPRIRREILERNYLLLPRNSRSSSKLFLSSASP